MHRSSGGAAPFQLLAEGVKSVWMEGAFSHAQGFALNSWFWLLLAATPKHPGYCPQLLLPVVLSSSSLVSGSSDKRHSSRRGTCSCRKGASLVTPGVTPTGLSVFSLCFSCRRLQGPLLSFGDNGLLQLRSMWGYCITLCLCHVLSWWPVLAVIAIISQSKMI